METIKQILASISPSRPLSRPHLYRALRKLRIRSHRRQRPARYPAGTAARILAHYGFAPSPAIVTTRALRAAKGGAK